ncbi:retrovirus-related pol polyprotein from transposon TNT 1-94 [Tanacetum coccineum]
MGQSTQIVHMLMKPQVFYDKNLKQALGFQNPFYIKKAQQIRTMLYEELSDEQALHPITDQSTSSPVNIKAPRELPKKGNRGKDIVNNAAHVSNATTIAPGMYKLEPVILAPKLIQELLDYVRDTCPDIHKPSKKLVAHLVKGAKALCSVCNECLFDANLAMCLIDHVNIVAPKQVVTRVYTRRPKVPKSVPNSKPKVAKSMTANSMKPDTSRGSDTSVAPSSSSLINCRLSKLFCGIWTPAAPRTNVYSLSIGDMMASSPICLLSKATKTKSWLWHCRLSHLNFGAINHLDRHSLVRGLPRLKFEKGHLCSACVMGKRKKQSHKPKFEDTYQEKLYLLHMDLYGPMHVASVNGKKYILVIVDDYSQFTWVKFLASKDEAPDFIIKFLKMIQVRLNANVRNIHTDNGIEFANQTLRLL